MIKELNGIAVIDSISDMTSDEVTYLLETGICYCKAPEDDKFKFSFQEIKDHGVNFFKKAEAEKSAVMGYVDRSKKPAPEFVEQLSFPMATPPLPFMPHFPTLQDLRKKIQQETVMPLLEKILIQVGKPEFYETIVDGDNTYISFVSYPSQNVNDIKPTLGFRKHKDFGIMTVLSIQEPGLKMQTMQNNQKVWVDVNPLKGYFVIMLANVLQLMLGKDKCKAVSHKVELADTERMAIGAFFNPANSAKITNIFSNEQLYDNFYPEYINVRLGKYS